MAPIWHDFVCVDTLRLSDASQGMELDWLLFIKVGNLKATLKSGLRLYQARCVA